MTAPAARPRVVAVVVTFNRRELVLESLTAVQAQSRSVDAVVVVDNASTDGTAEAVRAAHPQVRLLPLLRNTGGAGGFAVGLAAALRDDADYVWLMDDDTVPEPDALHELLAAVDRYGNPRPGLVASRVVWTDGRDHPMNTPRASIFAGRAQRAAARAAGCVAIRSASFVSVLVDAQRARQVGLPQADFFLWNDDFEFTGRVLRDRPGLWCPASVVVHKTKTFGSTDVSPGERFYFEVRNKLWTLRSRAAFSPVERIVFALSTLRRWLRTYRGADDRATLRAALRRGLRDGLRTRPHSNEAALADLDLDLNV